MVESWSLRSSYRKSSSYRPEKIGLNCQIYHGKNNINENALIKYRKEKSKSTHLKSQGQRKRKQIR